MRSKRLFHCALVAALLAAWLLLGSGCGSKSDAQPGTARAIDFDLTLTSVLQQTALAAPLALGGQGAAAGLAVTGPLIPSLLLVTNTGTLDYTVYDWPAYWNGASMAIEPTRTLLLEPGQYDFYLLLMYEKQQYAGSAHLVVTLEGQNTVPMTIRPIIGAPLVSVSQVAELADFRFQYNPSELSAFGNPQIGITVDAGSEQVFAVNPATGLSDAYTNIAAGTHQIQLRFYDAGLQIGKSPAVPSSVTVTPGVGFGIDLIPLYGTVRSSLDAVGEATFQYTLPGEILEELGGDGNLLSSIFSVVGVGNPLQQVQLGPSQAPPAFTGSTVLGGMVAGDVSMVFDLHNNAADPPTWFASCVVAQAFMSPPVNTKLCRFVLKRAVISGDLLATVAVNVFDVGMAAVPGAVVYVDGEMAGITGSGGFGTAGYLKLLLPAGPHTIRAEANGLYGEITVDLAPLALFDADIVLSTPL